jgi:hypothetical protein
MTATASQEKIAMLAKSSAKNSVWFPRLTTCLKSRLIGEPENTANASVKATQHPAT